MSGDRTVAVYGAYGHTAGFVVDELIRRGWTPRLGGRDAEKLADFGRLHASLPQYQVAVDDAARLDRLLDGVVAVINCAGPFLDTAASLIDAALRARVHYIDLAAEQTATLHAFEHYADAARAARICVLPAMAFYGGLADLLASAAMDDWRGADQPSVDEIRVGVALDSWHPTVGTRVTGRRNTARRFTIAAGAREFLADPPPTRSWTFPPPFGAQDMVALPLSEIVTISQHLRADTIASYMNLAPLHDLRDAQTPAPVATDASGRSAQIFAVEVVVSRDGAERRASACGRDIYAVSAPLVVEALERIVNGRIRRTGVAAAGEVFDAHDFLASLSPEPLRLAGHALRRPEISGVSR